MITYKIKSGSYICNLFLPEKQKGYFVVLLPGLPASFNLQILIKMLTNIGCVVLQPNLLGSFDSSGEFDPLLHIKEIKNILKIAKQKSFKELYFNKKIEINNENKYILISMSYSTPVALFGHKNMFEKLIFLSPVSLFNQKDISLVSVFNFKSQMFHLVSFLKSAFPFSYRIKDFKNLKDFLFGNFDFLRLNSILEKIKEIKVPTLFIHGKADLGYPVEVSYLLKRHSKNKNIKWFFPNTGHNVSSFDKKTFLVIKDFIEGK